MKSRTHDQSGGDQDPSEASGHHCINMVRATKVVTRAKDYGLSQPNLEKELDPPGTPLHIEKPVDKPEVAPCIPKGVLKRLGHNPILSCPELFCCRGLGPHSLCDVYTRSTSELSFAKEGFAFYAWCE